MPSLSDRPRRLAHAFYHVWPSCAISPLLSLPFRSFLSTIRAVKVIGVCLLCRLHQTAGTLAPRLVFGRGGQGPQGQFDRPHRDQAPGYPGGLPGKIGRAGGQVGRKSWSNPSGNPSANATPSGQKSLATKWRRAWLEASWRNVASGEAAPALLDQSRQTLGCGGPTVSSAL